ncbi:type II toxin-antitoxin system Phd/YefM family antitoxin [Bosea psychrotolerans]|uniref:Antitoxin n=1 Tax=Bosea psychrotolerans TaxID=1871628 RepID=A0A2S4LUW2_9HYPH|nr:type II toxin-antitoxin system prevent-host-death family antitoxin [Bosea psychrotolerans]POR46228.1 prevent-host-death family protein [Bosea psychrotolerans]
MVKSVSAAQANREFSKLMKLAESGEDVIVTSHGKPKVRIVRVEDGEDEAHRRQRAFDALTELLRSRPILNLPRATRDDMYE